jgi:hypothetical protein
MTPQSSTVTIWRSGRLAVPARQPRRRIDLEIMVGSALAVACAVVMALYVSVLQREVARSELLHEAQRTGHAVPVPCESDPDALRRGVCLTADPVAVSLR